MNAFILKTLINSIGIDNITSQANDLINEGIKWADAQPLEAGESKVVGLIYHNDGIPYFAAVSITVNGQIGRYIIDKPLSELIKQFVSNLK